MSKASGLSTNAKYSFDGTWFVTGVQSTTVFMISSTEKEISKGGTPVADTYLGFNDNNLRALASRTYVHARSNDFKMLETDGCHSRDINGIRDTGWEPYMFYAARVAQSDASASAGLTRQCAFGEDNNTQTIFINGTNFGTATLDTPILVTMRQKICDCSTELNGEKKPCMSTSGDYKCYAKDSNGACPLTSAGAKTKNCDTDTEYYPPRTLQVKSHGHDHVEIFSFSGFGRRHKIEIQVGKDRKATPTTSEEAFMRYLPPTVTGFETPDSLSGGSKIYRPDGTSRITILGFNFGSSNVTSSIDVRIGVEYDTDGTYCGNLEKCMKPCTDPQWYPSKNGGDSSSRGFPYIDCIIPKDTAGFKNMTVSIAGQKDDCSSNVRLCGLPLDYPTDRRAMSMNEFTNLTNLIDQIDSNPNGGLIFTCARSSETTQSYAKPGELCQDIDNGLEKEECEDAACSKPKAKPGFWRLDLDLQYACNEGNNRKPCQEDLTGRYSGQSITEALSSPFTQLFDTNEGEELCLAGIQSGSNATVCAEGKRTCGQRGGDAPGNCVFRRPKEARRAMGKEYWPFACPGTDLGATYNKDDLTAAQSACRAANPDAYEFVEALTIPGCPAARTNHLVDYSIYDEYPALNMSTTCYSVVACNPKSSCIGANTCGEGYEYQKHRCEVYNRDFPNNNNCSSDYDCRTRSSLTGKTSSGDAGLASACSESNPEDCSRCVIETDETTGHSQGKCQCTGGGPRCGLCTRSVSTEESIDGKVRSVAVPYFHVCIFLFILFLFCANNVSFQGEIP